MYKIVYNIVYRTKKKYFKVCPAISYTQSILSQQCLHRSDLKKITAERQTQTERQRLREMERERRKGDK